MTDLVAFVRARLDEDQAAATRGLDPGDIPAAKADNVSALHDEYQFEKLVITRGRVLREVEAKRRIIDLDGDWPYGAEMETGEAVTGWSDAIDRVLRLLALSYSDHPDYREEWRPSGTGA
jgi:hypothetical protein